MNFGHLFEADRDPSAAARLSEPKPYVKAFDAVYFGAWFADAIGKAGLGDDVVLHGLRKTAARQLAEAGCSEQEIQSITGHATSRMVAHYTKSADQRKRATAAITKLEDSR